METIIEYPGIRIYVPDLLEPKNRKKKRRHLTKEGRPKLGYTIEEEAAAAADRMTALHDWPFEHYMCTFCRHWHVGNMPIRRLRRRDETLLEIELGERAAGCLKRENFGTAAKRVNAIKKYAMVLYKKTERITWEHLGRVG